MPELLHALPTALPVVVAVFLLNWTPRHRSWARVLRAWLGIATIWGLVNLVCRACLPPSSAGHLSHQTAGSLLLDSIFTATLVLSIGLLLHRWLWPDTKGKVPSPAPERPRHDVN